MPEFNWLCFQHRAAVAGILRHKRSDVWIPVCVGVTQSPGQNRRKKTHHKRNAFWGADDEHDARTWSSSVFYLIMSADLMLRDVGSVTVASQLAHARGAGNSSNYNIREPRELWLQWRTIPTTSKPIINHAAFKSLSKKLNPAKCDLGVGRSNGATSHENSFR